MVRWAEEPQGDPRSRPRGRRAGGPDGRMAGWTIAIVGFCFFTLDPVQPVDASFYVPKATIGSSESNAMPDPCETSASQGNECQVRPDGGVMVRARELVVVL